MRLLFDQNLSHRLVNLLEDLFPESVHVKSVGLQEESDSKIWEYARENGFTIISKDIDFHQRSFLYGSPPKVIWMNVGNSSTEEILRLIKSNRARIQSFSQDESGAFLVISR